MPDYLLSDNQRRYRKTTLKHCMSEYTDLQFFVVDPVYHLTGYVDLWGQFCLDTKQTDTELYKEYLSSTKLLTFNGQAIGTFQSLPTLMFEAFKMWCLELKFRKDGVIWEIQAVVLRGADPVDNSKQVSFTVFVPMIQDTRPVVYQKDGSLVVEASGNVQAEGSIQTNQPPEG